MPEVKEVGYNGFRGFQPPASASKVRYVVLGNNVFFTATEDCREVTSTINAAEEIIEAIYKKEGLNRQKTCFYEILTAIGYPWHGKDYLELDELLVVTREGRPFVDGRHRVVSPGSHGLQAIELLASTS